MLHLPTLIIVSIVMNILLGFLMLVIYRLRQQQRCFVYWSVACFVFAGAAVTASLRAFIDAPLLTVYFADLLIILAPLIAVAGLREYLHYTRSFLYLRALWVCCAILLAPLHGEPLLAQLVTSIVLAGSFGYATLLLVKVPTRSVLPKLVLALLFGAHALIMIIQSSLLFTSVREGPLPSFAPLLEWILVNHLLLTTATAMVFPLLVFVSSENRLTQLANYDDLTKLFNRRAFYQQAEDHFSLSEVEENDFSALMLDLDHFKAINDQYGHAAGDACLRWVARQIRSQLREQDVAARVGGEEFSIALPGTDERAAIAIADRLLEAIGGEPFEYQGRPIQLTVSIGVIHRKSRHEALQALLIDADTALYTAKKQGRNQVVLAS